MEDTYFYIKKAEEAETSTDLKNVVINSLENDKKRWKEWIRYVVDDNGGPLKFAKLLGEDIKESTVKNWIYRGNYPERENIIRIGFVLGYTRKEMDKCLQRNGGYTPLSVKVLEDCVYIFVLEKLGLRSIEGYRKSRELIDKFSGKSKSDNQIVEYDAEDSIMMWEDFEKVNKVEQLEDFICENVEGVRKRNIRLKKQIEKYYQFTIAGCNAHGYNYSSIHKLCTEQKWPKRMEEMYSKIKNYSWNISTRNARESLIALCILLNMDVKLINETLKMIGMEPLGARNRVESAIIHVLAEAERKEIIQVEGTGEEQERYGAQMVCSMLINTLKDLELQNEVMAKKLIKDLEGCVKSMEESMGWIFSNREECILVLEDNTLFFYSLEGKESVIVGRKTESRKAIQPDLDLKSSTVSKIHGRFIKRGTEWLYTDSRETKNATLVNGKMRDWRLGPIKLRKKVAPGREEYDNYDVNILGIRGKKKRKGEVTPMILMIYISKEFFFNKWCAIPLNLNESVGIKIDENDNYHRDGINIYYRNGKYYLERYGSSKIVNINQEDIYLKSGDKRELKNMDKIKFFETDKFIIFTKKMILMGKFGL